MRYRAVIFDLFGTLVDSFQVEEYEAVLSQMAQVLGLRSSDFGRLWRETLPERERGEYPSAHDNIRYICSQLHSNPTASGVHAAVQLALEYSRQTFIPRLEAVEVLSRLRNQGLKIGLISDTNWFTPMLWPSSPLAPFIDAPVFSVNIRTRKPEARIYHYACHQLGVLPQDCLYVGDGGSNELTGASQVGMDALKIVIAEDGIQAYRPNADEWVGRQINSLGAVFDVLIDAEGR
ncbi:MAG TPA: HAD family hydrolase [Pyrinomonadaceae bacterium]|jgi:putative hydrolase of the HAD superfamily